MVTLEISNVPENLELRKAWLSILVTLEISNVPENLEPWKAPTPIDCKYLGSVNWPLNLEFPKEPSLIKVIFFPLIVNFEGFLFFFWKVKGNLILRIY